MAAGVSDAVTDPEPAKPQGPEVVLPSGVRYVDLKPGTGDEARDGKVLAVHYTGWLEDGTKFDSTQDCAQPLTLRLGAGDVIKGLDEGLVGMKVGGKRRLTIPPELGFGKEGGGERIPPNAILIYEVELISVR
ncbi:MAG TPA: FKBP-type peptidyl-prolyl cis-trans isomerase [Thermoanaerobaculia bacterium]|nr:FKBP-type peptidyl-prolyl cis-trans isomerase [Thermoanaerobaculia bacterium]